MKPASTTTSLPDAGVAAARSVATVDPHAPLLFVVNARSGHNDPQATRATIEAALQRAGRHAEFLTPEPGQLAQVAQDAAQRAVAGNTAVMAVGGDGTVNAIAQAAHRAGCAMGFVPQGTFNYFAREHGIPLEAGEAMQVLLQASPQPVQVGFVNDQIFLINSSVGLYPEMFEDREAYKRRFGRNRLVAIAASIFTIVTKHRRLHLQIETDGAARSIATPTLFVGNNRLQLDRVGLPDARVLDEGRLAAVMAQDASMWSLLWLLLRGAMGELGDVDSVESFAFHRMTVQRRHRFGRTRKMKVAFDGEVRHMAGPLEFRVAEKPLILLKPTAGAAQASAGRETT